MARRGPDDANPGRMKFSERTGVVTLSQTERNLPTTANVDARDFKDLACWLIVQTGPISLNVTTPFLRRPRRPDLRCCHRLGHSEKDRHTLTAATGRKRLVGRSRETHLVVLPVIHRPNVPCRTNGDIGHWRMAGGPLAKRRTAEVHEAAKVLGTTAEVLDIHDGELMVTLKNRKEYAAFLKDVTQWVVEKKRWKEAEDGEKIRPNIIEK